jgi:hypothetical protein
MTHSDLEVAWVADGIKALLTVRNGQDNFPEEFYQQAKELINLKDWSIE